MLDKQSTTKIATSLFVFFLFFLLTRRQRALSKVINYGPIKAYFLHVLFFGKVGLILTRFMV